MNENSLLHRLAAVERELRRRPGLRKRAEPTEPHVVDLGNGTFEWHLGTGQICLLAFDPSAPPTHELVEK